MKLENVKVGDVLTVRGTGFAEDFIQTFTIAKISAKYVYRENGVKINRYDGVIMPRGKYNTFYVYLINGNPIETH